MKWQAFGALWVRRLKRLVEFVAYGLFDCLALLGVSPQPRGQRIALVHVQLLGDAFLWLPYAQALVGALRREGCTPVVICEDGVRAVFATALPGCEIFSVTKHSFLRDPRTRWRSLHGLRRLGVARTYLCSHPRDGITQDAIVRALGAPATGFDAVYADRPAIDRALSRRLYGQLVKTNSGAHVQVHHRAFLQAAGYGGVPVIPVDFPVDPKAPLPDEYWVLAPGASRTFRRWPEQRFAEVALNLARRRPQLRCVIVGSAAERDQAGAIAARLGDSAINLAGQTGVLQLVDWIAHARLLLGNDSAAGHMAAAVDTPSVVVVGGGHWGLCYPYDPQEAPVRRPPVAVGHAMPCYGCDWRCVHTARTDRPFPCIEDVRVEDVFRAVDSLLDRPPSAARPAGQTPALGAGAHGHQAAQA